ncbi:MAG: type II toxin-antitoxin system HipA family toxin [Mogibacterium sp.]|nr:type II toxin-antitoxin system HipA family toxin [Mogibacterium sp.]
MRELQIRIEKNGDMVPVGRIIGNDPADARFQYYSAYRDDNGAVPISISLPLQEDPFSPMQTAAFFEGLLPEGFTRRSVAQWMNLDEGDYLSLLHGLGRECLGAICILEEGEHTEAAYEPVSAETIRDLAAEGVVKSSEIVTKAHLSLTGASGKVGLYYDSDQDRWYLPKGSAPSTHIVKQSHVRLSSIVTNEQLSLMTAARCGIAIPRSFIINTGSGQENEVLFATERYDRTISSQAEEISGLRRPLRLHQEDFSQAMGIPSARKYERGEDHYMKGMFDLLRLYSADPIADQLKLWDMIIFSFLIGNTDAHIKNFSLLYDADLRTILLAPAYDIISTVVYEQSTREMAFRIGGAKSIDEIDEEAFRRAAGEAGLGERMALSRFRTMCERFEPALARSAEELSEAGYLKAIELKESILETAGIRKHKK